MSLLTVNQEKCKQDGICAEVCPAGIIELKGKDAFPALSAGGEAVCISCGHCVAVCPHGAMSHVAMKSEACPPVRDEWLLNPEQAEHFLRSRRSIRNFKKQQVGQDVLEKLVDVARFAPSGHNLQPVQWAVIYHNDKVRCLAEGVIDWMRFLIQEGSSMVTTLNLKRVVTFWEAGFDPICRNAPHVIIANAHKENRAAPSACTIALTYLELAAPSFGLGACWAGYLNAAATSWTPLQEALELPEGNVSYGAMMVGYPKFKYYRLPLRNESKIIWR